jgi:hypothetical protein
MAAIAVCAGLAGSTDKAIGPCLGRLAALGRLETSIHSSTLRHPAKQLIYTYWVHDTSLAARPKPAPPNRPTARATTPSPRDVHW